MSNSDNDDQYSLKNVGKYILSIIIMTIMVILYFSCSGLVLYACKAAAAGLIPTNSEYYPYTNDKNTPIIGETTSNIFITNTDPQLSEKISFFLKDTPDINTRNSLIARLTKEKNKTNSQIVTYFITILQQLLSMDYWLLDKLLVNMNKSFPEILTILLGPLIFIMVIFNLTIFNYIYLMILWFYNMYLFFNPTTSDIDNSNKSNKSNDTSPGLVWGTLDIAYDIFFGFKPQNNKEDTHDLTMMDYITGAFIAFWFTILFFILLFLGWGFVPFIIVLITIISILGYKSQINNKSTNAFDIIKKLFKFYKATITGTLSTLLVLITFNSLGPLIGLISLGMLLVVFFSGIIPLFTDEPIDGLTPLITSNNKLQSGGRNAMFYSKFKTMNNTAFLKELKKISKKLNK